MDVSLDMAIVTAILALGVGVLVGMEIPLKWRKPRRVRCDLGEEVDRVTDETLRACGVRPLEQSAPWGCIHCGTGPFNGDPRGWEAHRDACTKNPHNREAYVPLPPGGIKVELRCAHDAHTLANAKPHDDKTLAHCTSRFPGHANGGPSLAECADKIMSSPRDPTIARVFREAAEREANGGTAVNA